MIKAADASIASAVFYWVISKEQTIRYAGGYDFV
jgi:hypothetical protein